MKSNLVGPINRRPPELPSVSNTRGPAMMYMCLLCHLCRTYHNFDRTFTMPCVRWGVDDGREDVNDNAMVKSVQRWDVQYDSVRSVQWWNQCNAAQQQQGIGSRGMWSWITLLEPSTSNRLFGCIFYF